MLLTFTVPHSGTTILMLQLRYTLLLLATLFLIDCYTCTLQQRFLKVFARTLILQDPHTRRSSMTQNTILCLHINWQSHNSSYLLAVRLLSLRWDGRSWANIRLCVARWKYKHLYQGKPYLISTIFKCRPSLCIHMHAKS